MSSIKKYNLNNKSISILESNNKTNTQNKASNRGFTENSFGLTEDDLDDIV